MDLQKVLAQYLSSQETGNVVSQIVLPEDARGLLQETTIHFVKSKFAVVLIGQHSWFSGLVAGRFG